MTIKNGTVVLIAVAGLATAAGADVVSSTFDGGDDGWLVADGNSPANESGTSQPEYMVSGGNEGGFITTVINWSGPAFFVAPAAYLGDQSDMVGGSIVVDRRFVRPDSQADTLQVDYEVDLTITDSSNSMTLAVDLSPVPLDSWESFEVTLGVAGGWFILGTGVAASEAEIAAVLGDLGDVRVRGNIRDTFGRVAIDNFGLVPTPGTLAVLGFAGLAAARRRR
ncbi:hypothetical protein MNBD_PLANCTO03-2132 [hydrothermal vent metagenome]|uniref:Laminin IV type A domain-containing protein n=1 Tax=hydrothermal vent metagenome TaxID=652676 RepID=A0A3B1DA48_9ZZZZ